MRSIAPVSASLSILAALAAAPSRAGEAVPVVQGNQAFALDLYARGVPGAVAVSRRGLLPRAHDPAVPPAEPAHRPAGIEGLATAAGYVRAVRRRIAAESSWLPGKVGGKPAYAAKLVGGEPVLLDVQQPEATRFSLLGAFLLELHLRQVVRTASGRTRLLDREIPDAVRALDQEWMQRLAACDQTRQARRGAVIAMHLAVMVGDNAARLLDDQRRRGEVPFAFGRERYGGVGLAAGDQCQAVGDRVHPT